MTLDAAYAGDPRSSAACPAAPLLPVSGQDLAVPLVGGGEIAYANLDYAASAPALRSVADHLAAVLPAYSSIHRGAGYPSMISTALYESARASVAATLRARRDDAVVFVRNTTDALNLLSRALPAGATVLHLDIEHHANQLPWRSHPYRCLPAADTLAQTLQDLDRALAAEPTTLLAVTGASNVTGELLPLAELIALSHRHGARIAVDAAQLAPHRQIDLSAHDVDYLAFSGHKMYAPYGAGVLVGRRDWLDQAEPYLGGGGAVHSVTPDDVVWAPAPHRHEAGTPNLLGAVALAAAQRHLDQLGEQAIAAHEHALRTRLLDGLASLPEVTTHRIWHDSSESIGVVTFSVKGHDPGMVAAYLSAEHGIGVRDGRFCAHPLLGRLIPGSAGALRASFGLGSTTAHVDRLLNALEALVAYGPAWKYGIEAGRWTPIADPRPMPAWVHDHGALFPTTAGASPCQQKTTT